MKVRTERAEEIVKHRCLKGWTFDECLDLADDLVGARKLLHEVAASFGESKHVKEVKRARLMILAYFLEEA